MTRNLPTHPPEPPRSGWANILALLRDIRLITVDWSLDDRDIARRVPDRSGGYDGRFNDDC